MVAGGARADAGGDVSEIADTTPAALSPGKSWSYRLPSFRVAAFLSLGLLVVFAAWAFFDLAYLNTTLLLSFDLGLQPYHQGFDLWRAHDWGILPRFITIVVLALLAIAALSLMFYKLFRGSIADRTLTNWFVVITLVAMWLSLFLGNQRLQELGCDWRLRQLVAWLQQDLPQLQQAWPAKGKLPYLGAFIVDQDTLVVSSYLETINDVHYHAFEPISMIDKLDDGGMVFHVSSREVTYIYYRPDDRPQSLPDATKRVTTRVAPHWFVEQFPID